ncbi:MAG TPA: spore protease YyaC [Clostridiales bacterium]|nr:spore protease YyaC [Clostridiales bacterium]
MKLNSKDQNNISYFNSSDKNTTFELGNRIYKLLSKYILSGKTIVFLCIGTDRATGDSLGPLIGYKLSKYKHHDYLVYGTLEQPVHAKNLDETIEIIKSLHDNSVIIAIDASLGRSTHVGYITLGEGSLKPGAGVNKELPAVGDIFITGIVNFSGVLDHMLLQTTRLNVVMSLADQIFLAINYCTYKIKLNNHTSAYSNISALSETY